MWSIGWSLLTGTVGRLALAAIGLGAAYLWVYNRGYNQADTLCELRVEAIKRQASEDTQKGVRNVLEQIEKARAARDAATRSVPDDKQGNPDPFLRDD